MSICYAKNYTWYNMKQTPMTIAHEIMSEYSAPCAVCGQTASEVHHWPKRQHKFQEILYATIWPLCNDCHTKAHAKNSSGEISIDLGQADEFYRLMRMHISLCLSRGIK